MAKDDMQEFLNELDSYEKAGDFGSKKSQIRKGENTGKNKVSYRSLADGIYRLDGFKKDQGEVRGYLKGALDVLGDKENDNRNVSIDTYKKIIDIASDSGLLDSNKSTRKQISDTIGMINDPEKKKEVASYTKEKLGGSYEKSSSDSYSKE